MPTDRDQPTPAPELDDNTAVPDSRDRLADLASPKEDTPREFVWPETAAPFVDRQIASGGEWVTYDKDGQISEQSSTWREGGKVVRTDTPWDSAAGKPGKPRRIQEYPLIPYGLSQEDPSGKELKRYDYFYNDQGRLACSREVEERFPKAITDSRGHKLEPSKEFIRRMFVYEYLPDGTVKETKVSNGDPISDVTLRPAVAKAA